jgi:hypothetical protein
VEGAEPVIADEDHVDERDLDERARFDQPTGDDIVCR